MKTAIGLAALLAGISLPVLALAQEAPQGTALEPIIVTAQKRRAESKDIPASIAVKTGETLSLRKTKRREDAIAAEPNAQTGAVTAKLYTSFTAIRGVGSALIESDPSVGIYVDGVGIGNAQAHSGTLLDVDRIEILRGPQGTLYGRNNIAGSVNIISNLPDPDHTGGEIGVDFGRFGTLGTTGIFNTPIGDNGWAVRGALSTSKTDGFLHSTVDGSDLGGGKDVHGRLSIAGDITDNLEFLGIVDIERQVLDGEMFGMPEADFLKGRRGVAVDDPTRIDSDLATASGQLTYQLDNGDKIVSITGFQKSAVEVSGNGFPLGYFAAYDALFQSMGFPDFRYRADNPFDGRYRQWSQEVRYVSEDNERFNWVTGLYGEFSRASRVYGANSTFTGGEATLSTRGDTDTVSLSAFADGTYALNDQWKLFGGIRIGHDRKTFDYDFNANATAQLLGLTGAFAPGYSAKLSEAYVTPRVGLQFEPMDGLNLYGGISSGYKSGGFNSGFVGLGDEGPYDSERIVSYELGLKSATLDNRLKVEASVFYIDWRDQQVQGFNVLTGATPISNAPRSESWGGELSVAYDLDDHWTLTAGAGYADATYKDYRNARALDGSGTVDVSGNQQQFVSRFTGSAGVTYQWETGWDDLVGKVGVNYRYRSSYYFDVQNTISQKGYGLVDAYAGLENDRYAAYVFAKNIGDVDYRIVAADLGTGKLVSPGDPLTLGGSFKVKF
ncbi:TonB-dependent receptor [Shinella sp. CPCC 101442]|uniref:TonB-dependent receptor n=1 Tax=Shinella sp. CPCC 101442 TaxID=2932265 RepID=UPI002153884F|nr:TonB-dependent receptor [Shinella sp. CPCC 101442]MCR6501343.1 TonB-dependent receptor [Shinella sp. CPCC 101442]